MKLNFEHPLTRPSGWLICVQVICSSENACDPCVSLDGCETKLSFSFSSLVKLMTGSSIFFLVAAKKLKRLSGLHDLISSRILYDLYYNSSATLRL